MITCPSPEQLALYAGSELERSELEGVRVHLSVCAACLREVEAFTRDCELLRMDVEISEAALQANREAILSRLPQRWFGWKAAAGAAAAIAAGLAWMLVQPVARQGNVGSFQAERSSTRHPPIPAPVKQMVSKEEAPPARRKVRRKPSRRQEDLLTSMESLLRPPAVLSAGSPGDVVITLQTEDPTVTIVLLEEESTGGEE